MIKAVKKIISPSIKRQYQNIRKFWGNQIRLDKLEFRLRNIETALDILIDNPRYVPSDSTGFNGQLIRKKIFNETINAIKFDAIVETGTWIGNTTGYMSEHSKLPIYTCELNHRFHSIAKMRLSDFENIHLELSDSPSYLNKLADGRLPHKNLFFYLDAHWYESLPLAEEIDIIAGNWENFVVMIDDFKVPNDDGYIYDDYGQGKVLSLGTIEKLIQKYDLTPFFPASPSSMETGHKRGCLVLSTSGAFKDKISQLDSLTQAGI